MGKHTIHRIHTLYLTRFVLSKVISSCRRLNCWCKYLQDNKESMRLHRSLNVLLLLWISWENHKSSLREADLFSMQSASMSRMRISSLPTMWFISTLRRWAFCWKTSRSARTSCSSSVSDFTLFSRTSFCKTPNMLWYPTQINPVTKIYGTKYRYGNTLYFYFV